jgi:L-arabinokinase
MTIVFYISGHGFGHASRQVEIINALVGLDPACRIVIRTAVEAGLLARTLAVPYRLLDGACDTGIAQPTSVAHDDEATVREAAAFYDSWPDRVTSDLDRLAPEKPALIVGDIPPLAFEVADRLGVPSVAIANFTWDWIYETQPGLDRAAPHLRPTLRAAYAKASLALELPLSGGFDVFPTRRALPFVARRSTQRREDTRRFFGLPPDAPVALLSFGGYGLPELDLSLVDCRSEWTVATTDRVGGPARSLSQPHVVEIAEAAFVIDRFRYEDLVAAVDVVITKPGYGIIAECIAAETALLYTSRGTFREYPVLVGALPRFLRSRFISQDDLFAGRWIEALTTLLAHPAPPERPATDGADIAARAILEVSGRSLSPTGISRD